jgi:hypothetical protein
MAFGAFDMRDHAHTAGVMFIARIIKTLGMGVSHGMLSVLSDADRHAVIAHFCTNHGCLPAGIVRDLSHFDLKTRYFLFLMPIGSGFGNCLG